MTNKSFQKLVETIKKLRAPDGCPWDKEQTFQSLAPHIVEEAYELADVMKSEDFENLREELGDVLLHVVMLSNMAEEQGEFTINEVVEDVTEKMIRRHPHVFGDVSVNSVDEVWDNWDAIKKNEEKKCPYDSIPKNMPALMKTQKLQKRITRNEADSEPIKVNVEKEVSEQIGELLFQCVNLARKCGVDAEEALQDYTNGLKKDLKDKS